MKEISKEFEYKGKTYGLVFNLNVMAVIQDKYGTLEKWGELTDGKDIDGKDTDGKDGEPNAEAIIFGIWAMINEYIDIQNEENGTSEKPLTLKQAGRMITDIGLSEATKKVNETVVESTQSAEKNA